MVTTPADLALSPRALLDRIFATVRAQLPALAAAGIDEDYLEAFLTRHERTLLGVVEAALRGSGGKAASAPTGSSGMLPEHWHASKRTAANLAALGVLAALRPGQRPTPEQAATLAQYSGWGGLSIQKVKGKLPPSLPEPEDFGLVHEYYTPARVWKAVADTLKGLTSSLMQGATIKALEPSAGIGRALRAFDGFPAPLQWTCVEYSALSSKMLAALYPDAEVHHAPFERWVGQNPDRRFDLVISNPPYGARDDAAAEDPEGHRFKTKRAYLYFILRTLSILRPGGIAAFVVPTGFLTARSPEFRKVREQVLLGNHLLGAFRLPSQAPDGMDAQESAVYDNFVTDLLFLQARPGTLAELAPDDVSVLEGRYFEVYPKHLLGKPVGELADGWDPSQPKGRRGYQVVGVFSGLPAWTPRAMHTGALVEATEGRKVAARGGLARQVVHAEGDLTADLESAVALGLRADTILGAVATGDATAAAGWAELRRDLLAWRQRFGDPLRNTGLKTLADRRVTGATRFLALWTPAGLAEVFQTPPVVGERYRGGFDLPSAAAWLYRQQAAKLTVPQLQAWMAEHGHPVTLGAITAKLLPAGWHLDGERWDELYPTADYTTGFLWPKHDRAKARAEAGDPIAAEQAKLLRKAIGWRSAPAILEECSAADSWLPMELVNEWVNEKMQRPHGQPTLTLIRDADGIVRPEVLAYTDLDNTDKRRTRGLSQETLCFIGWCNYDKELWTPKRSKIRDPDTGKEGLEPMEEARKKQLAGWAAAWNGWFGADESRMDRLEEHYNRQLRGYIAPSYTDDPLPVARWNPALRLHPYQTKAARRILHNRSGLLAFDTGLGKTYTGINVIAAARQEGWARRPVVLVPNSIVWKWKRDFERCLPDYKVLVIGSKRAMATRGKRKGRMVAEIDTPAERAAKWTTFQAGGADVVLLTYSALARQQIDPAFLSEYVNSTLSLRRSIAMTLEAKKKAEGGETTAAKGPSERRSAEMKARVKSWLADVLTPPKGHVYDPGIDWHKLGVDLLVVDEAQNFKNLFYSERDGEHKDTKRAWHLDFRCASVRAHSGGAGIVLLSATPAKNNPVEFYSMLHYLRPDVWEQVGVDNHEAFVQRFGFFQERLVPDAGGQNLIKREVMTRFKNLDELQSVVYRWADFKVAEDVGLKIPEAIVRKHPVLASKAQEDLLSNLFEDLAEVEEKLTNVAKMRGKGDPEIEKVYRALMDKKRALALRMYLVYIHPQLPGIGNDRAAIDKVDPHNGPKLKAIVDEIRATSNRVCNADGKWCLDCAHIIFVENIAAHYWMKALLVEAGISAERIAILNAEEAKDLEFRQQIVEGFNGVGEPGDEEYEEPAYDVVIANAIAYEGMDLQRRTCAIHHLDIPWEPATLQQRNGRGVRQGNKFGQVVIHFYFVEGSNEIQRIDRIERKRGWMSRPVRSWPQYPAASYRTVTAPGSRVTRSSTWASASRRSSRGRCAQAASTASRNRAGSTWSAVGSSFRAGSAASSIRARERWATRGAVMALASSSSIMPFMA